MSFKFSQIRCVNVINFLYHHKSIQSLWFDWIYDNNQKQNKKIQSLKSFTNKKMQWHLHVLWIFAAGSVGNITHITLHCQNEAQTVCYTKYTHSYKLSLSIFSQPTGRGAQRCTCRSSWAHSVSESLFQICLLLSVAACFSLLLLHFYIFAKIA